MKKKFEKIDRVIITGDPVEGNEAVKWCNEHGYKVLKVDVRLKSFDIKIIGEKKWKGLKWKK